MWDDAKHMCGYTQISLICVFYGFRKYFIIILIIIIFKKHFLSISWFIFALLYFSQHEKYMLESWPLCNLDKVRLKSLDLQLSGLFLTKAPQMTQRSSDVTVFNPQPAWQISSKPTTLKVSYLAKPEAAQPTLIWTFFFPNSGHMSAGTAVLLSSVARICILASPYSIKLLWFCLFTQQQERTFSCLSFWALAKICWSSQSEPELIRITGMFNLNSGFCSHL